MLTGIVAFPRMLPPAAARASRRIARDAVRSLHVELTLTPKPGLVCPRDNGSHHDMSAATLLRSLFSLRHYFAAIAASAYRGAPFPALQKLGIAAEQRMLAATGGVNAHRGAIFNLGLIAAAAAHLESESRRITPAALSATVQTRWAAAIGNAKPAAPSHGLIAAARYRAGGARLEAMRGFPSVFELALPTLRGALHERLDTRRALVQTTFMLIARLEDTNLLYRGGRDGLHFAQRSADRFIAAGGVHADDWEARARAIRNSFVERNLSPGGSADLLAATWFVHLITA